MTLTDYFETLRPVVLAVAVFSLSSCTLPELQMSDELRLAEATYASASLGNLDPYSGAAHLARGRALLAKKQQSRNDLYFARAAFERAALLRVDDPEPMYHVGYVNYRLGEFEPAYRAFAKAADLDGRADGWWLASLAAIRAKHELLGQAFYNRGQKARASRSKTLTGYMNSLFENPDRKTVALNTGAHRDPGFRCTEPDELTEDGRDICSENVVVELFVVKRSSDAGSRVGQDLVAELSVGLNGTLLDLTDMTTRTDGYDTSNGSTDTYNSSETETGRGRALTVDLASVNYALSFAADADSVSYVSATPVINARLGEEATMFSGQNTQIIPANSDADAVESETGMKVQIELDAMTERTVSLKADIEFSADTAPVFGTNFARIEKQSTSISASGQIGYNQALLLGSVELSQREDSTSGQKGLRKLPVFGGVFGQISTSVSRTEVAVLATVRPPAAVTYDQEALDLKNMRQFGVRSPSTAKRSATVHNAPALSVILSEIGVDT
ncbi:MAG: hypothetical protein ACWA47_06885 [Brevirhabdus sp.]